MRKPIWLLLLVSIWCRGSIYAGELVDDREIRIESARDVEVKRGVLVEFIWGKEGFPEKLLPRVKANLAAPVKGLTNLARVDELRVELAKELEGLGYHFVPKRSNGELVVVHHGHACTLDDEPGAKDVGYGLQRTIHALLREGYGVLGVFMPRMRPGDCGGSHDALFKMETTGSAMRFFLDTTAASLNYLSKEGDFPGYRKFHMTGLSGGGWTTTIYAAVDTRISSSFPVAGSIPHYLRTGGSVGDLEQSLPEFYKLAGYPELYLMGSHGAGRKQVQILVRRDDCCFGEAQHDPKQFTMRYEESVRDYERRIQQTLEKIGNGSFRVEIDESAPSHMISHYAIEKVILPGIRGKAERSKGSVSP